MADPARDREVRLFRRVAEQRLDAARLLYRHKFYLESVYLAGYGVECGMKGLILQRTPAREFAAMLRRLTRVGARGHSFEYLRAILVDAPCRCPMPRAIVEQLRIVVRWSPELRYRAGRLPAPAAHQFLKAAQDIADWAARS
jgi:HEPN domain-containing protein